MSRGAQRGAPAAAPGLRPSFVRSARPRWPVLALLVLGVLGASEVQAGDGPALPEAKARVDLNRADVDELCTLPGIGEKRAQSIIRYRERRPFTRVTQLLNIKGIGHKTLKKLRPRLTVGAPPQRKARGGASGDGKAKAKGSAPGPRERSSPPEGARGMTPPTGCPPVNRGTAFRPPLRLPERDSSVEG